MAPIRIGRRLHALPNDSSVAFLSAAALFAMSRVGFLLWRLLYARPSTTLLSISAWANVPIPVTLSKMLNTTNARRFIINLPRSRPAPRGTPSCRIARSLWLTCLPDLVLSDLVCDLSGRETQGPGRFRLHPAGPIKGLVQPPPFDVLQTGPQRCRVMKPIGVRRTGRHGNL